MVEMTNNGKYRIITELLPLFLGEGWEGVKPIHKKPYLCTLKLTTKDTWD